MWPSISVKLRIIKNVFAKSSDPGFYKLTTEVDYGTNRYEELMTDCGDQSHYKAFFTFEKIPDSGDSCWFYNYDSPEARKEGFKYRSLMNCRDVADFCYVYANQTTECNSIMEGSHR